MPTATAAAARTSRVCKLEDMVAPPDASGIASKVRRKFDWTMVSGGSGARTSIPSCNGPGALGGMIAQQMARERPAIFRRMILVGTAPRGGDDITHLEKDLDRPSSPEVAGPQVAAFREWEQSPRFADLKHICQPTLLSGLRTRIRVPVPRVVHAAGCGVSRFGLSLAPC